MLLQVYLRRPALDAIVHTPTPCDTAIIATFRPLCDHSGGSGALVSPGWWEDTDGLVIPGQAMDAGFDENQTELGVLVLSVALKMLADSDGLLNQHVEVFWDLRGEAIGLQDSENLVTSNDLDLRNTVRISEDNTDLGRGCALLCKLADLVDNLFRGGLEPRRGGARVWDGGG